jgi:hypothetical protein
MGPSRGNAFARLTRLTRTPAVNADAKEEPRVPNTESSASPAGFIRGRKVIFDFDLADLSGVGTKALNQAVSRNVEGFPPDFMFTLMLQEVASLRSQIVTSNRGGRRYAPRVFTQEGMAMLSGTPRSKRAVKVNVSIMRASVRLRELLATNEELACTRSCAVGCTIRVLGSGVGIRGYKIAPKKR